MRLLAGATDEQLVELARAGDEQAFAAIVERYRGPLLQYCRGFLPGAAAEDALQQTFINAYAALSKADARAPVALRPWLYRVAHNAALNVARDPQAGLAELPEGLDGVRRPDEVVAARERFRRVVGAVSALPPKQRQVIVRHALDGESHERIASDLGMSAGSIRQLAHRARRTVREAAAAVIPAPLLRFLPPFGADAVEAVPAAGGGAVLAKVAVAVVVAGAAGGGAVEVSTRAEKPAQAASHVRPAPVRTPVATPPARPAPLVSVGGSSGSSRKGSSGRRDESSGSGSSGRGSSESSDSGSSGPGSGSSGSGSGSSGPGSGSSGPGGGSSGSSGSGSSGHGSPGSSGSGSSGSGNGSSAPGSGSSGPGSGSSGPGSGSSGPGSGTSGSGSSGSSGSGSTSSGNGSSGSGKDSSGSGSGSSGSGKGSSDSPVVTVPTAEPELPGGHGSGH